VAGRDQEALRLLGQYEGDATALRSYSRALLTYRNKGDSAEARRLLDKARKVNPYVPRHFLGEAEPVWFGDGYSPGSPEEAAFCAETCAEAWKASPGALDWLAAIAGISSSSGWRSRRPLSPERLFRCSARQLSTWQGLPLAGAAGRIALTRAMG
jgi:hypothetical protein